MRIIIFEHPHVRLVLLVAVDDKGKAEWCLGELWDLLTLLR